MGLSVQKLEKRFQIYDLAGKLVDSRGIGFIVEFNPLHAIMNRKYPRPEFVEPLRNNLLRGSSSQNAFFGEAENFLLMYASITGESTQELLSVTTPDREALLSVSYYGREYGGNIKLGCISAGVIAPMLGLSQPQDFICQRTLTFYGTRKFNPLKDVCEFLQGYFR